MPTRQMTSVRGQGGMNTQPSQEAQLVSRPCTMAPAGGSIIGADGKDDLLFKAGFPAWLHRRLETGWSD